MINKKYRAAIVLTLYFLFFSPLPRIILGFYQGINVQSNS
jgi:hypothetical protein